MTSRSNLSPGARVSRLGVSALYASVYLHYGIIQPFLPVWYQNRGFTGEQIAIFLAIPMFVKVFALAPVMTLADRLRRVRDLTWLITATAAAILFLLSYVQGFLVMCAVTVLFAFFWDPIPVLTDAYAVGASKDCQLNFGRLRVWASVMIAAGSLASGWLLYRIDVARTVWIASAMLAAPLLILPLLPSDRTFEGARPAQRGEWRGLLHDRSLVLMIVGVSLVVASHSLLYNFSSIQWLHHGMSSTVVGMLWATGFSSEFLLLWFGEKLLAGRSPALLVTTGAAAAVTRWCLMALSPTVAVLFAIQLLHGLSIMAPILGMMLYIERRVAPQLIASAQGLYAPTWNGLMGLCTAACGPLDRLLGNNAYLVMAAVAAAGGVVAYGALQERSGNLKGAARGAH